MKNTLFRFILGILIFSFVFNLYAPTAFSLSENTSGPDGVFSVRQRLSVIMQSYPDKSYFTDDGKACDHHLDCSLFEDCNCKEVNEQEAGTPGNKQCYGFARFVFYNVFGLSYPHFNNKAYWKVMEEEEKNNVTELWSYEPKCVDRSYVKELFSLCSVGDVIQWGLPHSMVFLEAGDDGVLVYDANFDMATCQVGVHLIDWKTMQKYIYTYGASAYRAANYPDLDKKPSGVVTEKPFKPLSVYGSDFYGLELFLDMGREQYKLSAIEDGLWKISDGLFFERIVGLSSEDEFALKLWLLGKGEQGSISLSFLNKNLRIPAEVMVLPKLLEYGAPLKTQYRAGEPLSVEGAWIRYIDRNGIEKTVFCDQLEFSLFEPKTVGKQSVIVSFDGVAFSYELEVLPFEDEGDRHIAEEKREPHLVLTAVIMAAVLVFALLCFRLIQKQSLNEDKGIKNP